MTLCSTWKSSPGYSNSLFLIAVCNTNCICILGCGENLSSCSPLPGCDASCVCPSGTADRANFRCIFRQPCEATTEMWPESTTNSLVTPTQKCEWKQKYVYSMISSSSVSNTCTTCQDVSGFSEPFIYDLISIILSKWVCFSIYPHQAEAMI